MGTRHWGGDKPYGVARGGPRGACLLLPAPPPGMSPPPPGCHRGVRLSLTPPGVVWGPRAGPPPASPSALRARGTRVRGGGRGARARSRRQQGAGGHGGAAGRRGGPPGAAREPEGGCRQGPGLRDGTRGSGSGARDTHPTATPPRGRGRAGRGSSSPHPPAAPGAPLRTGGSLPGRARGSQPPGAPPAPWPFYRSKHRRGGWRCRGAAGPGGPGGC